MKKSSICSKKFPAGGGTAARFAAAFGAAGPPANIDAAKGTALAFGRRLAPCGN
jgi:hypothetical protein